MMGWRCSRCRASSSSRRGRQSETNVAWKTSLIACYANDYIGYVVPPAAYEEGGYEAGITFCTPEAEGLIMDASLELLREIADGD